MTNNRLTVVLATLLVLIVGGGAFFAVTQNPANPASNPAQATEPVEETLPYPEGGGTLILRVNPEFAIHYDASGVVVGVEARNDDAENMKLDLTALEGMACREAVRTLVERINDAGYFVEEVEGEGNTINLEVESGSALPEENFLRNIVHESETYVVGQNMTVPMEVSGTTDYGWTNYGDSDYGPDSDGVTDYYDSDYGP